MGKPAINLKNDLKQLERVGGRAGADTIRLWEGYREQAYLWRSVSLLQMPATALSMAAVLVMYFFADTVIEVPHAPDPGIYSVKQLPDSQFVNAALSVVNLIATYQPAIARRNFTTTKKFLWEPALSEFEQTMMESEIRAIEETKRSQMFFINQRLIKVERFPEQDMVVVRVPGERVKLIGNKPLPPDQMVYYVKMTTIPRNIHNEYGIVVTDIRLRRADERTVSKEDKAEERSDHRQDLKAARENKMGATGSTN